MSLKATALEREKKKNLTSETHQNIMAVFFILPLKDLRFRHVKLTSG